MNDIEKRNSMTPAAPKGRGFEEPTDKEDLIIPRAKLLQGLSPELQDNQDLKQGMIINSLTQEVLSGNFIPIFKFTNWIRFNPRSSDDPNYNPDYEPGAIIWRSTDPLDPRVQKEGMFGEDGTPPLATKFLNFFSIFEGSAIPVIVSFSKTSFKAGRHLLSLAQFSGGDMFSRKYKLRSELIKGDRGSYYVLKIAVAGAPTEDEYKAAEQLYTDFSSRKDIKVHEEAPEEDNTDFDFKD